MRPPNAGPAGTTNAPRQLLTRQQAMARLHVGETKLHDLLKTGELQSVQIGRARRIPADAVDRYIERLLAEQTGGAA
jgi:excisionase family DNA binding protein